MDKVIERLEELANIIVEPIGYISPVRAREEMVQRLDLCLDYDLAKILMELDDRSHNTLVIRTEDESIAIMDTGQDYIIRLETYDEDSGLSNGLACMMLNPEQMEKIETFLEESRRVRERERDARILQEGEVKLVNLSKSPARYRDCKHVTTHHGTCVYCGERQY